MKTIMKRIAALVLIAAMAVMAVAGCSKSSGSKSAGKECRHNVWPCKRGTVT